MRLLSCSKFVYSLCKGLGLYFTDVSISLEFASVIYQISLIISFYKKVASSFSVFSRSQCTRPRKKVIFYNAGKVSALII
jgi:hypothetical protein